MGFLASEVNWMSWALSCLQLKKLYGEVELYTNTTGKEVLIDRLNLPYTKVHTVLDEIKYEKQLWAFPKVYTYSLQQQPFIHIDGDVFMWEKMNHKLLNADLIAQNIETDNGFYTKIMARLIESDIWFNESIKQQIKSKAEYAAYNAGIFGGNDIAFFKEYTEQAFKLITKNRDRFNEMDLGKFNMIYEQYLFYCLALQFDKPVECYFPESVIDISYKGFANFLEVPYKTKFIHMLGDYKRIEDVCVMLAKRLRQDYPEYYYRIIAECKKTSTSQLFVYYGAYNFNAQLENPIWKMISSVMSSLYEMELQNIKERTTIGRMVYVQNGGILGRPSGSNESELKFLQKESSQQIIKSLKKGLTIREVSKVVNVSTKTVMKVKALIA